MAKYQRSVEDIWFLVRDDSSSDPIYVAKYNEQDEWYIMKRTQSTGITKYYKGSGSSALATAWSNRTSLTYHEYWEVF